MKIERHTFEFSAFFENIKIDFSNHIFTADLDLICEAEAIGCSYYEANQEITELSLNYVKILDIEASFLDDNFEVFEKKTILQKNIALNDFMDIMARLKEMAIDQAQTELPSYYHVILRT